MRITSLIENTTSTEACEPEFGLSLLIEANGRTVLFDAGQTGKIVANAEALGVDLARVDTCVLSHGHFDHANGFPAFLQVNNTAPIYVHEGYDAECFKDEDEYIGVTPALIGHERLKVVRGRVDLGDGFVIDDFAELPSVHPLRPGPLNVRIGDEFEPDTFGHEHYLIVTEGKRRVLVSGCSHRGIENIMSWGTTYDVNFMVGGFHLMDLDPTDEQALETAAEELLAHPVDYATCHCTGLAQYAVLERIMGQRVRYLATGASIEL